MPRLVIVSNRVAVPTEGGSRAGGLEVAVRAALRSYPGLWFGWSGRVVPTAADVVTETIEREEMTYVVTDLTEEDYQEYYNGFANRVLWPLMHYRLDLAEFSRRDLGGYLRVNRHFASECQKVLRPDDLIWVHDYHLLPFAAALREQGHRNHIGFFLHIPLPPPELLAAMPRHERLLPALCHYDLVGFQTDGDADNFARYLANECRLPSRDDRNFSTIERNVRIGAFPVGIETSEFARLARRSIRSPFVTEVLSSLAGKAMIIGVDRLDYSKGIGVRMEAFERFLGDSPEWRGKVTFLQITPKSRSEIPEYIEIEQEVTATAGRINGTYGEAAWTPLRYVNRSHSRSALAGLYRAARAALVTPLRDGMNLVAKEYVAAQDPDDPGVLILSRFAGAAVELEDALVVNPYDPEAVAAAIGRALSMPIEERRMRHASLYAACERSDIKRWPERFLGELTSSARAPNPIGRLSSVSVL